MTVWGITVSYVIVAGLWILLSDRALTVLVSDSVLLTSFQTVKGWLFVLVTAVMMHLLITRYGKAITDSEHKLRKNNEELAASNEELLAVEEELRQQCDELVNYQYQIDRQNQYLAALHETALDLMNKLDRNQLLADIVQKAVSLGNSQHGYLYLLNQETQEMEARVVSGLAIQQVGFSQGKGAGVVGRVWESGSPVIVEDYQTWDGRLPGTDFNILQVSTGFPLKADGSVIGVIGVNYTEKRVIDEALIRLMASFAELASIAIANAQLHSALKESQIQARVLIDSLPDLICRFDKEGTLLAWEPGKEYTAKYDLRDKIGQNIYNLLPAGFAEKILVNTRRALESRAMQIFEYDLSDQSRTIHREFRMLPINEGEVLGVIRDITEQKEMEERLRFMSLHDTLTGLYSRMYFQEELERLSDPRHMPVGVIVCDIDGLKLVNDSLGQEVGDQLLAAVADILQSCFGSGDVVARVGGDEFAVLMPKCDQAAVEKTCQQIRNAVEKYKIANPEMPLSLSLGIGVKTSKNQDINDIYKMADDSMYREKLHQGQSVRSAIVNTLAKALEARDFVTDGHADRLQDIVEMMARTIGVTENHIPDYRLLARFHDIGKVGISDSILFKPGRLTPEEFEVMKRHCEIGYRIALASPELAPIADWILKHQEWWNGEGYPLGVKGEDIPLACRILSLADAYDAMTNDRPYRKAMTHEMAMTEIMRCSGRQFDPGLASVFTEAIKPTDVNSSSA